MGMIFSREKNRLKSKLECSAVILAAGASERMKGPSKTTLLLEGKPVLAHTLSVFENCHCVKEIIVVVRENELTDIAQMCRDYEINKASKILVGGNSRTQSALIGVLEISPYINFAAIHDGARPLITDEIITSAVKAAIEHLASVPGISVKDTVKIVKSSFSEKTLDRENLVAVQTPQVFEKDIIKAALSDALIKSINFTDDCAAVEALGVKPFIVPGSEENIKITTPIDVILAEAILKSRRQKCE